MSNVRTRFAPSPTGYMHVGGIRTALFAWLLAKHENGSFILRIEDTDKKREIPGSTEHIIKCLTALGLNYDEGPNKDGQFGPYIQSQRLAIYRQWAERLIEQGRAYADPYSSEELNQFREEATKQHEPFLFRNHRPDSPPTWSEGRPLRFKSNPKPYEWHDEVMGDLSAGEEAIDDFIIIKPDGFPTYNFAHIVDDYEMQISHIMRGHEFIASVPNYLNLYEALNIQHPLFVTPPPVLGPTGNKKLSKRDGAKDILEYFNEGFLEEALVNFIASLGWNDGTTKELFNRQELIESFALNRVQRSGARFDDKRLLWMNGAHIRALPIDELYDRSIDFWPQEAADYDHQYKKQVLSLVKERLKYLAELPGLSRFFFTDLPINPELISSNKKLTALGNSTLKSLLEKSLTVFEDSNFSINDLTDKLNSLLSATNQTPGILFSLIRIATTQAPSSPPLAESLSTIGKQRSLERLRNQIAAL